MRHAAPRSQDARARTRLRPRPRQSPRRPAFLPALPPARGIYLIACILLRCPRVRRRQAPRRRRVCILPYEWFYAVSPPTPVFFGAWPPSARAGGVSCRRAFVPHGYAPQLPCFRSALSAMPATKYAARRLRCSKHAAPARACPRPRLSTRPVRSAQIRAAPAARLPACRPCLSARRFLRRLFRRASQSCAPGAPVSAQCRRAVTTRRI